MAKFLVLCFILTTDFFLFLPVADGRVAVANPPASSPYYNGPAASWKIGKMWLEKGATTPSNDHIGAGENIVSAGGQDKKQHHRGFDKSVYGGGVILGGLATTFLVAVFCYIRATARKNASDVTPSSSPSASPKVLVTNPV